MNRLIKNTGTLFALMLFACTMNGQTRATDSLATAELVFYRAFIPKMNAPLKKVPIYLNDTLVQELKANTIWRKKIFPAKKMRVAIDGKGETTTIMNPQPGTVYYFKCEVLYGLWFGKPAFQLVTPDIGEAECEELEIKTAKKK